MQWIDEFLGCHYLSMSGMGGASWVQWAWPDGRPYLEQSAIRAQAFRIMLAEATAALAQAAAHGGINQD